MQRRAQLATVHGDVLLLESRSGTVHISTEVTAVWLTTFYWNEELRQATALFTAATISAFFVAQRRCVTDNAHHLSGSDRPALQLLCLRRLLQTECSGKPTRLSLDEMLYHKAQ